jgi:hypothetical protein
VHAPQRADGVGHLAGAGRAGAVAAVDAVVDDVAAGRAARLATLS